MTEGKTFVKVEEVWLTKQTEIILIYDWYIFHQVFQRGLINLLCPLFSQGQDFRPRKGASFRENERKRDREGKGQNQ